MITIIINTMNNFTKLRRFVFEFNFRKFCKILRTFMKFFEILQISIKLYEFYIARETTRRNILSDFMKFRTYLNKVKYFTKYYIAKKNDG